MPGPFDELNESLKAFGPVVDVANRVLAMASDAKKLMEATRSVAIMVSKEAELRERLSDLESLYEAKHGEIQARHDEHVKALASLAEKARIESERTVTSVRRESTDYIAARERDRQQVLKALDSEKAKLEEARRLASDEKARRDAAEREASASFEETQARRRLELKGLTDRIAEARKIDTEIRERLASIGAVSR